MKIIVVMTPAEKVFWEAVGEAFRGQAGNFFTICVLAGFVWWVSSWPLTQSWEEWVRGATVFFFGGACLTGLCEMLVGIKKIIAPAIALSNKFSCDTRRGQYQLF